MRVDRLLTVPAGGTDQVLSRSMALSAAWEDAVAPETQLRIRRSTTAESSFECIVGPVAKRDNSRRFRSSLETARKLIETAIEAMMAA